MTITTSNTAGEIVQESLELLGVLGEGEVYNAAQGASMLKTLNSLCTAWQADGLNLFAVDHVEMLIKPKTSNYVIDLGGTANTIWTRQTRRYASTQSSSQGTTASVYVADSSGIKEGDSIHLYFEQEGFTQEGWWTGTIDTLFTSGTSHQIILTSIIPGSISEGDAVFVSDGSLVTRPMSILNGNFVTRGGSSIPCKSISREEYYALTRRDITGSSLQVYYDKKYPTANLYLYPVPTDTHTYMSFAVQAQLDSPSLTENIAFPPEWFTPLAYNLAFAASAKFGTPQFEYYRIREQAKYYYDMAQGFDKEEGTSLYFQPREPHS